MMNFIQIDLRIGIDKKGFAKTAIYLIILAFLLGYHFLNSSFSMVYAATTIEMWVKKPSAMGMGEITNKLASWSYRNPITVFNPGPALAYYQVSVNLDTHSLIDHAIDELPITISSVGTALTDYQVNVVITNAAILSHMTMDGRDIRFFNESTNNPYGDDTNKLNFWIESISPSKLSVWVKTTIPATGGKTIYMYYGNYSATSISNGNNVFVFFDDFNGTAINTTKWTEIDNGNYLSQNGRLIATGGSGAWTSNGLVSVNNFTRADSLEVRWDYTPTGGNYFMFGWKDTEAGTSYTNLVYGYYDYANSVYVYEDGTPRGLKTGAWTHGITYKVKMPLKTGGGATYQKSGDGGQTWETSYSSSYSTETPLKIGLLNYDGAFEIDNLFVRKYSSTEPTISIGTETVKQTVAGEMRSDCGDVRFTDSDGTTLLNYWLESGCNSTSTKFWVNVTSIPSGNKTIYIYYGNPSAASASNGNNVFVFFDDFNDGSLDTTNRWTVGGGIPTESGGVVTVDSNGEYIYSKLSYGVNTSLMYNGSHPNVESNWVGYIVGANSPFAIVERYPASAWGARSYISAQTYTPYNTSLLGSYHKYEIARNGTVNAYYFDDKLNATHTSQVTTNALPLTIYYYSAIAGSLSVDWIALRNYTYPEPYTQNISKVQECTSSGQYNPFICAFNYNECLYQGIYQGNAKVYINSVFSSESGWQDLYECILGYNTTYEPCGNGVVDSGENCLTCPDDAGCLLDQVCQADGACGDNPLRNCDFDGVCDSDETCDCHDCAGDLDGQGTQDGCIKGDICLNSTQKCGCNSDFDDVCTPDPNCQGSDPDCGPVVGCTCGNWYDVGCGINPCSLTETKQVRDCTGNCEMVGKYGCTPATVCLSNYYYSADKNYLNVFWNSYYSTSESNRNRQIAVNCTFNCDPRNSTSDCIPLQQCSPNPVVRLPGAGSCSVVGPKYKYGSQKDKIVCRVYDPTDPSKEAWY